MSEEPHPKQIFFVSWKQHKLELAKERIHEIAGSFIDEIIFNTIIDYCRVEHGFPGALKLSDMIVNNPVLPTTTANFDQITFDNNDNQRRSAKCPVCNDTVDARLFTSHLETCIRKCNPLEVAIKIAKKED
ncbi:hypothetical protein TVAG_014210 [Trichomonas vaginalis G3]|uniref:Uncharacterized protein n=1 Tax=Trichomonas vaginalis (strain ATCC PRA-98 / G3) TaxID=412133 RepID=A2DDH5_TRIV3|nr:classic zinc finger domain-containing protein [Trichomonas vaginalis G3]EAY21654.1 hypothetical protein TVAG_014210 [Trichomonas vaginalis G3]KAI5489671.1 classic zinc finger domain-containing protein [Trichomonas vaginalis G3]|eukprot:XP_001582640.1 hypothetical protein [Trichomonas vaginalis G3]